MPDALTHISNQSLLSRLDELAARERRITLVILDHLNEVERRDLFLEHGYSSMFAYCTTRLGYSASAASRRIRTARCVRRFPCVRELLQCNEVNLSTVSMVAGILNETNHRDLLERITGRSQRDVEAVVAGFKPRVPVRDTVKPIVVRPAAAREAPAPQNRTLACEYDRSGRDAADPPPSRRGAGAVPSTCNPSPPTKPQTDNGNAQPEKQFMIRFAAGSDLVQQIETARSLLAFRLPAGASLAQVLSRVLGEFIERNDPSRRAARREKKRTGQDGTRSAAQRDAKRAAKTAVQQNPRRTAADRETKTPSLNPRAIPAAVRDSVFAGSESRCEYVSPSGTRCDAISYLQIDHIAPVALGGDASRENLRVLCARHNRYEADRILSRIRRT